MIGIYFWNAANTGMHFSGTIFCFSHPSNLAHGNMISLVGDCSSQLPSLLPPGLLCMLCPCCPCHVSWPTPGHPPRQSPYRTRSSPLWQLPHTLEWPHIPLLKQLESGIPLSFPALPTNL